MKFWNSCLGFLVCAAAISTAIAQAPVLSTLEAPYPALQSQVTMGGNTYGPGTVAYGPQGTPLVLSGSNLGDNGAVWFFASKNGGPDYTATPAQGVVTSWTARQILLKVPSGAFSGFVQVVTGIGTSNPLPFVVTQGAYSSSCPTGPSSSQLQITTNSLPDGILSQSYSVQLTATGGSASYSWSLASNSSSLPAGLSLSSSGVISGQPTTIGGPTTVTVQVVDTSTPQQHDEAALSLSISDQAQSGTSSALYSFSIQTANGSAEGYDPVGNVTGYSDVVTGNWSIGYDTLNRLLSATAGSQTDTLYPYVCWSYDSFGNRSAQSQQTAACSSTTIAQSASTLVFGGNNEVTGVIPPNGSSPSPSPYTYDSAGNVTMDVANGKQYLYDGEGRICAVADVAVQGQPIMTQYLYDAEGNRVAKGSINAWSCDTTANGFSASSVYVLDLGGEQLTEVTNNAGNWQWAHTNVFAPGLSATYDADPSQQTEGWMYFQLSDWLGTRRQQTDYAGNPCLNYTSLPYGDGLTPIPIPCLNPSDDATEHHFTGKERDAESGNDYFGARYYASNMGRWLSPDKPFADQHASNPQSWNLYEYGRNNPLRNVDPNGFKVLAAYVAEAVAKMNAMQGHGTFYLDFAGIQGLHNHPSITASSFDKWHSPGEHTANNAEVVPNNGILSGFFRAFLGLANKDQVDTGRAIVAAAPAGVDIAFDTYSNGVNAAGQVAQGMEPGDLASATVVGPNANSPAPVQTMDQADLDTTQIYISDLDPALAFALLGYQTAEGWESEFPGRVHVTDQPSHNLDEYRNAQNHSHRDNPGFCPAEFVRCD